MFNILQELIYIGENYLDSGAGHVVLYRNKSYVVLGVTAEELQVGDYSSRVQRYKTIIVVADNGRVYQIPYNADHWQRVKPATQTKPERIEPMSKAPVNRPVKRERLFNIPKPKDKP